MLMVYIASPYTKDPVAGVRQQLEVADRLMSAGYCPVAPLLSHFQHIYHPRPYSDWMNIDLEKISRCDIVLRLNGVSPGADYEVKQAKKLGIPVVHSVEEIISAGRI